MNNLFTTENLTSILNNKDCVVDDWDKFSKQFKMSISDIICDCFNNQRYINCGAIIANPYKNDGWHYIKMPPQALYTINSKKIEFLKNIKEHYKDLARFQMFEVDMDRLIQDIAIETYRQVVILNPGIDTVKTKKSIQERLGVEF